MKDAIVSWVVFSMIAIDYFGPESGSAIMFVMLIGGIIWFTRSKWRLWQWYRQHDEYVRLGDTALHFCIYPQSGSLHYANIVQVIHWYEERMTGKDEEVYDKNIGIIITTRQQHTVHLNLERMVQENDGLWRKQRHRHPRVGRKNEMAKTCPPNPPVNRKAACILCFAVQAA